MLTKLKEKLSTFREYFCRGGFNIPTEKEIDNAPLVLPEPKMKLAVSETKIDVAPSITSMDWHSPFPVITGGIRGWLRGDFNLPTQKQIDQPKYFSKMSLKYLLRKFR